MFTPIQMETWQRREYFEHYSKEIPCTYSLTSTLDIFPIRRSGEKIYPAMIYLITQVINRHEEFRIAVNRNGILGTYNKLHPCYTVFHEDTETFSNIWTKYSTNYADFRRDYEHDTSIYGNIQGINAKPNPPENCFPISMIPWVHFTGFQLNLPKGYHYFLPIFTMGQFYSKKKHILIPISIQVHHAVCDGFHVSRFLNELQEAINIWNEPITK